MLDKEAVHCPTVIYRPIQPSDLEVLERIHAALFPIRYELEFFLNAVNGHGIVSWAAVDISRPDGHSDELIGFVTARIISAKESEIADLLRCHSSKTDVTLVYILTLGVVEPYRNLGIATSLVRKVINYASSLVTCRAVYLHVIDYNLPAIHFYKKMSFQLVRRLPKFYYIKGQHYDSYLFVYYVNSGRSPCSPRELVAAIAAYFRGLFRTLGAKVWKSEEKHFHRWAKCKDSNSLLSMQNKRILSAENVASQCV